MCGVAGGAAARSAAMTRRQFGHVKYVNLRTVLPATKNLWANELHPKEQGFKLAAKNLAALL
jgi:hypothetical protein